MTTTATAFVKVHGNGLVTADPVAEAMALLDAQDTAVLEDMLEHCVHPAEAWLLRVVLDRRTRKEETK